jgi:gas vesicle protein
VGGLVGAGAALLLAPAAGIEVRRGLSRRGRHIRNRAGDYWDDLRYELRRAQRMRDRRKRFERISAAAE